MAANGICHAQTITEANHVEYDFPMDKQLYPRKADNQGHPKVSGMFSNSPGVEASAICLRIYTTNENDDAFSRVLIYEECTPTASPGASSIAFDFEPAIAASLTDYRFELAADLSGAGMTTFRTASWVVAGDVFVITGQSNAVAAAGGPSERDPTSAGNHWARSFGGFTGNQASYSPPDHEKWAYSTGFGHKNDPSQIHNYPFAQSGTIGLYLQKYISTDYEVPVCILNGGVGSTSILHHTPSAIPMTPADIKLNYHASGITFEGIHVGNPNYYHFYDRLYQKALLAGVLEDVKAIVWIQGVADASGNETITLNPGDHPHTYYPKVFDHIYRAWHLDFPNLQQVYVFQETVSTTMKNAPNWGPISCKPNLAASLREIQRSFGMLYPDVTVLSQMGIGFPHRHKLNVTDCKVDKIHYKESGYQLMADRLFKVIGRDFYCDDRFTAVPVTPPNLRRAYKESGKIVLEFDQDIYFEDHLSFAYDWIFPNCNVVTRSLGWDLDHSFYDGCGSRLNISSWQVQGNLLKLGTGLIPGKITYLGKEHYPLSDKKTYEGPWLWNAARDNGALAFFNVPIDNSESVSVPRDGSLTHVETRVENVPPDCESDEFSDGYVCGDLLDATLVTSPLIQNCHGCPGAYANVPAGRSVTFRAGNAIKLLPGFSVEKGGLLHGYISSEHCVSSGAFYKSSSGQVEYSSSDVHLHESTLANDLSFDLYPNPGDGWFNLNISNPGKENLNLQLSDTYGKILLTRHLEGDRTSLDLKGFPSGVYWVLIRSGKKMAVKKMVLTP